ncbi:MAG: hypothetical protein JWM78_2201 [Verrucomicrobiaceae bacterium]|nr:hypothetical protein [Verrucomicrobiaceae bacterium]
MKLSQSRTLFSSRFSPFKKLIGLVTVAIVLALAGTLAFSVTLPVKVKKQPDNYSVRGYLAAVVGGTGLAEKAGIYARGVAQKNIYLPGVDVYLLDPKTGKNSDAVKTDLSGRFTLFAPATGQYQLCWKSRAYDAGCTPAFIDANGQAQFLSTVYISLPRKQDMVAIMGHIEDADGDSLRTLDPYLNINAFATVALQDLKGKALVDVYVNNFGDYLLPYVPAKGNVQVLARVEGGKVAQEIRSEADLTQTPLHQLNLKVQNHHPHLNPLTVTDISGKRVQNATPGDELKLSAVARDDDGDTIKFSWFVGEGDGTLLQNSGDSVSWKLPATEGRYTVTAVAYDGKGGYDKAVLSVLADKNGVPFTGTVVESGGAPIALANIEIVGSPIIQTDANGRFTTRVKESDRYVFNVRKEGYALNSQIYDRGISGGKWTLRRAQVVSVDPTQPIRISHKRGERDCPGPDSLRASPGVAGESIYTPQWQDGKGHVIDAPVESNSALTRADISRVKKMPVVLTRNLKIPRCNPGVSVELPANAIEDAKGNLVTTPIDIGISSVDLLSPEQMPGDESVIPSAGGGGYIESFGAGALDLPAGMHLKAGASAKVIIPVDRSRQIGGAALPPTVPLLSYDEKKGLWIEEGILTLGTINGVQSYVGTVKHFSAFNADNVKNATSSCVRIFSPTLPSKYDLEVAAPFGGTGAPKILKKEIDQTSSTENVIYNLPNNTNITLTPMTQGANPQVLGFYIVNSGAPQNPNTSPNVPPGPPYTSCNNFVVLKLGSAPDSPFGGEFLHGLGYIGAGNFGFDDLTNAGPTGNALRDALVTASKNYYSSVDPNNNRDTFAKFKSSHGFSANPNTPAAGETVAQFANTGDLGFGRDMHCKKSGANIACYVTNYGTGYNNIHPGAGTDDHDDANAAGQRATVGLSKEVATVAMEYTAIDNDPVGDRTVKFYVYKKDFPNAGDYNRSISANLDGRGERPVPQLCMICHGGQVPQQSGGAPIFSAANDVKLNARFLPFDYRLYTFPSNPALPSTAQDASFKTFNQVIVDNVPTGAPTSDPIREVVRALYNDATHTNSPTQLLDSPVPNWKTGASAAAAGQQNFYDRVFANACRTCHIAQPFAQLQFNTSQKFLHVTTSQFGVSANNFLMLGTAQSRVCGDYTMPHALRTHDIFWGVFSDINPAIAAISMPTEFQAFGDGLGGAATAGAWKPNLCTSFLASTVSVPSNFYQHDIQTIWNGKCVACHISGGIGPFSLTEGNSYANLVPGRVVAGNDNPATAGNTLLARITAAAPGGGRMPPNCFRAPEPPNGNVPCLVQTDVDKIKAWIRSGAN